MGYDDWLEEPYQRQADGPDDCPECGAALILDSVEQSVSCEECPYQDGKDWEAEHEARMEAREPEGDTWGGL